jgi:hypothetical protein
MYKPLKTLWGACFSAAAERESLRAVGAYKIL